MFIFIKSRTTLKLGIVGLKSRLLGVGHIIDKPCVLSRGHSFDPKFMKLCQNNNPLNIWFKFETGSCWIKKLGH